MPTVGSLPKALEWQEWWAYWGDRIHEGQPWVRFLVDATTVLQQMHVTTSRILRKKPNWHTEGWTVAEWCPVIEVAEERNAWFQKNKPKICDIPKWAEFLLTALEGSFLMQVRLAKEVDQINRRGHLLINVNPLTPDEIAERGEETN